jgi:hypothetical protein
LGVQRSQRDRPDAPQARNIFRLGPDENSRQTLRQPLSLPWRKDNQSPLLAGFVADVQRIPDVRGMNTGQA